MRYHNIILGLVLVLLLPVAYGQTLHVDGKIYADGYVDIGSISISDRPQTTPLGSGEKRYVFALSDDSGRILSQSIISSYILHYDSFDTGMGGDIRPDGYDFLVRLPMSHDIVTLMITEEDSGRLLYYADLVDASCSGLCLGCAEYYGIECDPTIIPVSDNDPIVSLLIVIILLLIVVFAVLIVMKRWNNK